MREAPKQMDLNPVFSHSNSFPSPLHWYSILPIVCLWNFVFTFSNEIGFEL